MSYLHLFTLAVFVCEWWFPTHIVLGFCFVVLRLVYLVLPDCPFLIVFSVFSILHCIAYKISYYIISNEYVISISFC